MSQVDIVYMIETKPLFASSSNCVDMVKLTRKCTLLILEVKGQDHRKMFGCLGMLRFALPLYEKLFYVKYVIHEYMSCICCYCVTAQSMYKSLQQLLKTDFKKPHMLVKI